MKNLPLILVASFIFKGASWRVVAAQGPDTFSATLLAAGCIVLGAWIGDAASAKTIIRKNVETVEDEDE